MSSSTNPEKFLVLTRNISTIGSLVHSGVSGFVLELKTFNDFMNIPDESVSSLMCVYFLREREEKNE